jgi:hypothetical protein
MGAGRTWRVRIGPRAYEIARPDGTAASGARGDSVRSARVLFRAVEQGDRAAREAIEEALGRRREAAAAPHPRDHRARDASQVDALRRDFLFAVESGVLVVRESADGAPGASGGPPRPETEPPPAQEEETTWYEVRVVDEVGQPVSGLGLSFTVAGRASTVPTDGGGIARVTGPRGTVSVVLDRVETAFTLLEPRWRTARTGTPPSGPDVLTIPLVDPFPSTDLRPEKTRTIVLDPPLTTLEVEKVSFVGDHGVMKVNTKDWEDSGPAPTKPEWTRGGKETRPVSYTMKSVVKAQVELSAAPVKGPVEPLELGGKPSFSDLAAFKGDGQARGSPPPAELTAGTLPESVMALRGAIEWKGKTKRTGRELRAGRSDGHAIYVTLGTPDPIDTTQEHGITEKRMAKAVELVAKARALDPHSIVGSLMRLFRFYTLRPSPDVPAEFDHPTFFGSSSGAWPMADYISKSGECQAIVRFVRAVIKQVGCPGTADLVVIWADPDFHGGAKAKEATVPPGGGLHGKSKMVGGERWYACLVDTYPEEGKIYDTEVVGPDYIGLNNFEACLRFEHGGLTKYYGGGAGVYDSAEQVLLAFFGLAWITFATHPSGHSGAKVEKVVKRWRDRAGNILP